MTNWKHVVIATGIGFLLVAFTIQFSNFTFHQFKSPSDQTEQTKSKKIQSDVDISRNENQNYYGNKDAKITIVEFSDFECPFCAQLHTTLKRIVDESDGAIKWEHRNLPLPSHRNAELAAYIGECVARVEGLDSFWNYADQVYANQRNVEESFLTALANQQGVTDEVLTSCLEDESIAEIVEGDKEVARALGGSGTPFSVVLFEDGTFQTVSGALPYLQWKNIIK